MISSAMSQSRIVGVDAGHDPESPDGRAGGELPKTGNNDRAETNSVLCIRRSRWH